MLQDTHTAEGAGITAMLEALTVGVDGAAEAVLLWRAQDMLNVIRGLAPLFGIQPSSNLLAYSRTESQQLAETIEKGPSLFLQVSRGPSSARLRFDDATTLEGTSMLMQRVVATCSDDSILTCSLNSHAALSKTTE